MFQVHGNVFTNLARVGFVFSFDLPRGVIFVSHNTNRALTEFDVDRVRDAYPTHVVSLMDDATRIVVL